MMLGGNLENYSIFLFLFYSGFDFTILSYFINEMPYLSRY